MRACARLVPGVGRAALVALCLATGACKLDEKTVAPGQEHIAIHGVLNPLGAQEFEVLVERTLTGRVETTDTLFAADDPIVSGGGVPVTGAEVTIIGPSPRPARGIEAVRDRTDGRGRGVYRFLNAPSGLQSRGHEIVLRRGERYTLRVRTGDGRELTASTIIPIGTLKYDTLDGRPFDVERDTFRIAWNRAAGARAYALQIQSPYGPLQLFTSDTSIALTGDLRNVFASRFPRAFVPGYRTTILIASVDTNYFDYYRSFNNPFTGSGILNRVEGGIGVFGSYVPVLTKRVEVTAPIDHPLEGEWIRADSLTGERLRLYLDGDVLVSGRYFDAARQEHGVLGDRAGPRAGSRLSLQVLRGVVARDVLFRYGGEQRGDSLVLQAAPGGPAAATYRRVGAP